MTKENKGFQSRLDDYCTDSEDDSKEVTLMGLLGRMQWQWDMYVARHKIIPLKIFSPPLKIHVKNGSPPLEMHTKNGSPPLERHIKNGSPPLKFIYC